MRSRFFNSIKAIGGKVSGLFPTSLTKSMTYLLALSTATCAEASNFYFKDNRNISLYKLFSLDVNFKKSQIQHVLALCNATKTEDIFPDRFDQLDEISIYSGMGGDSITIETFLRSFNDTACDFFENCIIKNIHSLYSAELAEQGKIVGCVIGGIASICFLCWCIHCLSEKYENRRRTETGLKSEELSIQILDNPFRHAIARSHGYQSIGNT